MDQMISWLAMRATGSRERVLHVDPNEACLSPFLVGNSRRGTKAKASLSLPGFPRFLPVDKEIVKYGPAWTASGEFAPRQVSCLSTDGVIHKYYRTTSATVPATH